MRSDFSPVQVPVPGGTGSAQCVEAFGDTPNFLQVTITDREEGSLSVEFSFDEESWFEFAGMDALIVSVLLPAKYGGDYIAPKFIRVKTTTEFDGTGMVTYCGTNTQAN